MADTFTRRINLYINGKEVKNDIASIRSEMNKLVAQQARMTRGSEEYVKAGNQIRNLKAIINEHNESLRTTSGLWDKLGKMGDNFNRYFSLFAAFGSAIFLANTGVPKNDIKDYIRITFDYDLDFTLDEMRPTYRFSEICQDSVPQAIVAFLESSDYESCIRLAISIGGDSDTIACMAGGIAAAYYKFIPDYILEETLKRLPEEFIEIIEKFDNYKILG